MSSLRTTPTAKTFADAWTTRFSTVLKEAAGKDARLTLTEARRIAERTDGGKLWSDNAVAYLQAKGQQSVSVNVLLAAANSYALESAKTAAGADGKVSFADAKKLKADLYDDFMYLRGKGPADAPQRTAAQLKADVRDQVLNAIESGTAVKLSGPPASVRGRNPVDDDIRHAATNTRMEAYVADGDIYVSRGSPDPSALVGWYKVGKLPEASTGAGERRAKLEPLTAGLNVGSESDARVQYLSSGTFSGPLTADLVRQRFSKAHDTTVGWVNYFPGGQYDALFDRTTVETRDANQFLAAMGTVHDPSDTVSADNARRWQSLTAALKAELTDLKVYRFGGPHFSTFVVGKARNGELAGVYTGQVET